MMPYTLKEVDLAKRKGPFRFRHGWIPIGDTPRGGSHLKMSTETRHTVTDTKDITEVTRKIDLVAHKVKTAKPGTTEHEHAVEELSAHLESLQRFTKTAAKDVEEHKSHVRLQGAGSSVDRRLYSIKTTLKAATEKPTTEFGAETAHHVVTGEIAKTAISAGTKAAGALATVLGAASAEHFSEQFARLAENPASHAAVVVAAALLLRALVVRVKKWLQERHDARIREARTA